MNHRLAAVLMSLVFSGCYTTKLYNTDDVDTFKERIVPGRTHIQTSGVWAWGLVTPTRVNLTGYCQQTGIRNIRTQVSVPGILLGIVTLGIYSQTSTVIICKPKDRGEKNDEKAAGGQEPPSETVKENKAEAPPETPEAASEGSESSESSDK